MISLKLLSQLMNTDAKSMTIKLMNVGKQTRVVNCGLHAIAMRRYLALGTDPTIVVLNNAEFRPHLINIFETKKTSAFSTKKRRMPQNSIRKETVCDVKSEMVCYDLCQEWFHITCINSCMPDENGWYCDSFSDELSACLNRFHAAL